MRDRGSSTVWVALCAVALSLGYPEGRGLAAESETRGTAKEPPPTIQELKNATYMRFDLGPVTLVDGWWHGEPPVKGSASGPTVHLLGDFRLVGDLEGDGREEAVVLLGESGGGSGTYVYLAVVPADRRPGSDQERTHRERTHIPGPRPARAQRPGVLPRRAGHP
jgi:hypothetical protein